MRHFSASTINRIAKITIFVACFFVINFLVGIALIPSETYSNQVVKTYSEKENIDVAYFGTSVGYHIDASQINSKLGINSVNMCTPNQFVDSSVMVSELVCSQNPIETIVLFAGVDTFEQPVYYSSHLTLNKAIFASQPLFVRLFSEFRIKLDNSLRKENLLTTDSINGMFSWIFDTTHSFSTIVDNVKVKADNYVHGRNDLKYNLDPYKVSNQIVTDFDYGCSAQEIHDLESISFENISISKESMDGLDRLIRFCSVNNIDFALIITPHQRDYKTELGEDYIVADEYLRKFVTSRGMHYLNADSDDNLRLLLDDDEDFSDKEHLAGDGVSIVSDYIADYLASIM